jgi:hypothetical protein
MSKKSAALLRFRPSCLMWRRYCFAVKLASKFCTVGVFRSINVRKDPDKIVNYGDHP